MEDGCRYDTLRSLKAADASDGDFQELQASSRPFLLTDVVGLDFAGWWCGEVTKQLAAAPVYFIDGKGIDGSRTAMQGQFDVFVDEVGRLSDRDRFAYMQSELLPDAAPDLVRKLCQNLPPALPVGERNLFSRWPRGISPAPLLLTVGGEGARTQLGREGLAAAQWHLCLLGHARFKLLPHEPSRLEPLRAREEPFGIFGEDGKPLFDVSLNSHSELDLFATEMADHVAWTHLDAYGPDFERWPDAKLLPRALEVLLKPGEMLVLPGGWWAQLYFDQPSWLASASYLDEAGLDRVLHGVLDHCGVEPDSIFALDCMPAEQRIDAVLAAGLGSKGRGDGRRVLDGLRRIDLRQAPQAVSSAAPQGGGEEKRAQEEEEEKKSRPACDICGRPATTVCGRCKSLRLCGAECQRRSWPEHRKECVRAR